jgi:saccharopine dehydrogenase (NAD+, L-lysine-forming)
MIQLGIIREGKNPPDKRVPFTPEQCASLQQSGRFHVVVQPSSVRAFTDEEYRHAGIELKEDLSSCDLLMGVKEVPVEQVIADKHYLFFAHVIKKQPYNRKLMQVMVRKRITLTDYECLRDAGGDRVLGFGKFAGIVGAYNALLGWGKRYKSFDLKPAHACFDLAELKTELKKVVLPPLKIVLTGTGRVGQGAIEIMDALGIRRVEAPEFLSTQFNEPVFTVINYDSYYRNKSGKPFDKQEFFSHPDRFESAFLPFAHEARIFISCHYWDSSSPRLFTMDEMKDPAFSLELIADITCDIKGSIPSTVRASTIAEPFYGFDPRTGNEVDAFRTDCVTMMAVDNLPCELPRDSSEFFGSELLKKVMPLFYEIDSEEILTRGTILKQGKLTTGFDYLADFAAE